LAFLNTKRLDAADITNILYCPLSNADEKKEGHNKNQSALELIVKDRFTLE
jgi:hypothetical protein